VSTRARAVSLTAVLITTLLAGCSSNGGAVATPSAATSTARTGDCTGHGMVVHRTAPFGTAGHRGVEVYLPPCYGSGTGQRFATVYLLHGGSADETQWPDVGITAAADELVAAGEAPPLIIVMPDGGPDMPDSLAKDLVNHLIPWTDHTFRTLDDPSQRAVGGISLGGRIALEAAADHPRLFAAVGGHSPAVASGHQDLAARLGRTPAAIRLDVGDADSLRNGVERFAATARHAGATVQVSVGTGKHDRAYWRSQRRAYLEFYAAALTSSPPPNPGLRGG